MSGYEPLQSLIADQLAEERGRKQAIQQGGLSVITSSGTMVTLLFALGPLVWGDGTLTLQPVGKTLLAAAAVAFSVAAVLAILVQRPRFYEEAGTRWLRTVTQPTVWDVISSTTASRRAAEARVNAIASFRIRNRQKVRLLTLALSFEALAITLIVATIVVLFG